MQTIAIVKPDHDKSKEKSAIFPLSDTRLQLEWTCQYKLQPLNKLDNIERHTLFKLDFGMYTVIVSYLSRPTEFCMRFFMCTSSSAERFFKKKSAVELLQRNIVNKKGKSVYVI